ncbi:hypothetical protein ADUPG1_012868 [Aduncisulcus paluster]|uniref:Uncharacterized protein n=1 Tax=Aduncisulcus paluster TaxID=2918883 RepID=A0ABQ5K560_9EUKA|nr:hypothetical protein ADUPG1_012868 [Aduncisulcus paluster]
MSLEESFFRYLKTYLVQHEVSISDPKVKQLLFTSFKRRLKYIIEKALQAREFRLGEKLFPPATCGIVSDVIIPYDLFLAVKTKKPSTISVGPFKSAEEALTVRAQDRRMKQDQISFPKAPKTKGRFVKSEDLTLGKRRVLETFFKKSLADHQSSESLRITREISKFDCKSFQKTQLSKKAESIAKKYVGYVPASADPKDVQFPSLPAPYHAPISIARPMEPNTAIIDKYIHMLYRDNDPRQIHRPSLLYDSKIYYKALPARNMTNPINLNDVLYVLRHDPGAQLHSRQLLFLLSCLPPPAADECQNKSCFDPRKYFAAQTSSAPIMSSSIGYSGQPSHPMSMSHSTPGMHTPSHVHPSMSYASTPQSRMIHPSSSQPQHPHSSLAGTPMASPAQHQHAQPQVLHHPQQQGQVHHHQVYSRSLMAGAGGQVSPMGHAGTPQGHPQQQQGAGSIQRSSSGAILHSRVQPTPSAIAQQQQAAYQQQQKIILYIQSIFTRYEITEHTTKPELDAKILSMAPEEKQWDLILHMPKKGKVLQPKQTDFDVIDVISELEGHFIVLTSELDQIEQDILSLKLYTEKYGTNLPFKRQLVHLKYLKQEKKRLLSKVKFQVDLFRLHLTAGKDLNRQLRRENCNITLKPRESPTITCESSIIFSATQEGTLLHESKSCNTRVINCNINKFSF